MEWGDGGNKRHFRIIVAVNVLANHQDTHNVIFIGTQLKPKHTVRFLE